MKINNKSVSNGTTIKPKSKIKVPIIVGIVFVALSFALFFGLKAALATEDYYVLNQDLAAKTQVTETMLKKVTTSKNTAPQNAISINQVKQGTVFTRIPLRAGDVLSSSNTGIDLDASSGIPDDWVVTSFDINPGLAVNGLVKKGDYFDIIGVSLEEGSKYLFHNVLALQVMSNGQMYKDANEQITTGASDGEALTYVVGMPADDAAKLHYALAKYDIIKTILAPASLKYKYRDVSDLEEPFFMDAESIPSDLFDGTDSTFTPVLKDDNGRPVNKKNCKLRKIVPAELCDQLPDEPETKPIPRDGEENKEEIEKERNERKEEQDEKSKANHEETNRKPKSQSELLNRKSKDASEQEAKEVEEKVEEQNGTR